jgi:hypothetical protein
VATARYIVLPCHHNFNDCIMPDCRVQKVYEARLIFIVQEIWPSVLTKLLLMMRISLLIYSSVQETLTVEGDDSSKYKNNAFGMLHIPCKLQCKIYT